MIELLEDMRRKLSANKKTSQNAKEEIKSFIKSLRQRIKKQDYDADVFLGGSYAKGTDLGIPDIDIFVRFNPEYSDISPKLKQVLEGMDYVELKGSRNYYRVGRYELVPILRITSPEQAKNTTDFSPLHVGYIKKHLKRPEDVKLLKLFCKSLNIYGAEDYVSGFSGYVLELLICEHGSFSNLVKRAAKWVPKVYIDPGKHYENLEQAVSSISPSKSNSPIILIDPTCKTRNACSSLSNENFSKFVFAARMFCSRPSKSFFKQKKLTREALERDSIKKGTKVFFRGIKFKGKRDIFFSKLKKKISKIKNSLEKQGFLVHSCGFTEEFIYFEMELWKTSGVRKHAGPFVWSPKEHFEKFVKKWGEVYVENSRLTTNVHSAKSAGILLRKLFREQGL